MRRLSSICLRLIAAASLTVYVALASAGPVSAQSTGWQHIIDCAGLLFTNPAQHAKECGPGHEYTGPFSHAWGSENVTPPPVNNCSPTTAYRGTPGEPFLLQVQSDPCCPPVSYRGPQLGEPQVMPVVGCCPSAFHYQETEGFVLQVGCFTGALLSEELMSPLLLI